MIGNLWQIVSNSIFFRLLVNSHSVVISSSVTMTAPPKMQPNNLASHGHYREFDGAMVAGNVAFIAGKRTLGAQFVD